MARASVPVAERPPPLPRPLPSAGAVRYVLRLPQSPPPLRGVHIDGDIARVPADVLGLIGQPITPQLVARIEARINHVLAAEGRTVTVRYEPSPAGDAGVLSFATRPFTVTGLTVRGGGADTAARLHLREGQPVDPAALAFRLENLNRYPFRQVDVTVAPAGRANASAVTVEIADTKPWTAYWGVKYAGGPHETWRRLYAGGSMGDVLGQDSVLSIQVTESPDALLRTRRHRQMADGAIAYSLPVGERGQVEAGYELTGMTFRFPPDIYWLVENDGTLGYRYFLTGPASGPGQSDVRIGLDLRHERTIDYQDDQPVFDAAAEINEVYLGYHFNQVRPDRQSDIDVALRLSPAVDMPGTKAAHYAAYTGGRMKSARYGYVLLAVDETVGPAAGAQWHSQVSAMAASGPVPYWDQMILGGQGNVRGYFMADGSFDDAVVWRNELRLPVKGALAPFVLADIAIGHDDQLKVTKTLASAGVGVNVKLSAAVSLTCDAAYALRHGPVTAAGTTVFEAVLKTSY